MREAGPTLAAGRADLRPSRCAVCGTANNATELYPARLGPGAFQPPTFSARRSPDRLHYRIVRCRQCGLVRSDPVADAALLAALYRDSALTYAEEIPCLRRTYRRYLARLAAHGVARGSLLEIGCGNGFFLEEALRAGYRRVRGVEPSRAAVSRAHPAIRPHLICDVMRPDLFDREEFDTICLFQVADHVADPAALVAECRRLLAPGGALLCITHDVDALPSRLLGEASPVFDVEHTYFYSRRTIARLLEGQGLGVVRTGRIVDTHRLSYLATLLPLPALLKGALREFLGRTGLGRLPARFPLGNLYAIGQKPPRREGTARASA